MYVFCNTIIFSFLEWKLSLKYILVIMSWDWDNLSNSFHAKFDMLHDWTCNITLLSKQLLIMVKDNVLVSSQSFMLIVLVVGKVGVPTTSWVAIGGVVFGSIPHFKNNKIIWISMLIYERIYWKRFHYIWKIDVAYVYFLCHCICCYLILFTLKNQIWFMIEIMANKFLSHCVSSLLTIFIYLLCKLITYINWCIIYLLALSL